MIVAFNLAGFFAAHAIWSVSDGEALVPMFAYVSESGEKQMQRLVIDGDLEKSVAFGQAKLESNESDASDGVLVYDGRIPIDDRMVDAVIVEIRSYFSLDSKAVMAVPYALAAPGELRVFKPKLLQWEECEDFDIDRSVQSFFEGVDAHEHGAAIWNKALDQSM
ncbi:hypothetical protein SAMN05428959_101617 [Duganella sp. CF517]|uniref:hypothetical protein n=1 Tax=Duganella sp. CF517 TaxID=1881038 RepID=UPI0008CB5F2C|nr:hypothetical protein [Duganella sp. CF517]SEN19504.1 hypothetical protein SAMN05428959_101617 [Duganella sp. CF517]